MLRAMPWSRAVSGSLDQGKMNGCIFSSGQMKGTVRNSKGDTTQPSSRSRVTVG